MKSTVALIRCDSYRDISKLYEAVKRGIHLLGGVESFAGPGETIVLKPNILAGENPDKAVTTHPSVFKAVAEIFKTSGANIKYGDSPAMSRPEKAAQKGHYHEIAEALGIELADFSTASAVSHPSALLAKQLVLAKGALEADGLVSISKMKTHGLCRITGAVKNQFGCIPGMRKGEYHVKMPDVFDFSRVLVDINTYLNMRLYIMDGVVAMEGNGPRSGDPVDMKALLFSRDPVALDAVCCRLMGLDPKYVPTIQLGQDAGLGTCDFQKIDIVGSNIETLVNRSFKVERRMPDRLASADVFPTWLKNWISPRPVIESSRCVSCGNCILQCPVEFKAINWPNNDKSKQPVFDYNLCIRCYCCQEICPERAISIRTPLLGKLIYR